MHPSFHAARTPDKPAYIMGSGEAVSYAQLDRRSNQYAHLLRARGLAAGDTIVFSIGNSPEFLQIAWGAQRAGLRYVPVSNKLTADEIAYIAADCDARLIIASHSHCELADSIAAQDCRPAMFALGVPMPGFEDLAGALAAMPDTPLADETAGVEMLYSSGTTGRPKGIAAQRDAARRIDAPEPVTEAIRSKFGVSSDSVYLCPAPLYHAAAIRWCMAMSRIGATAVVMEKFDAEAALELIGRYAVTHAQFVPTHFVRMLKLPSGARERAMTSSLQAVIHAAAPCPIPVKEAMLAWFGPIIYEYYGGSEMNGSTSIGPREWMEHKGSVGRSATETVHICDEQGRELPPRSEGLVYFSGGRDFEYHNDPEKTRDARHPEGWTTLGDIGWLDEDGYLYLTDRKSFMVISGGVNIYPQEIENLLITHPRVADVAVIGAPDDDMGERVVAVVQPAQWSDAGEALAAELDAFARDRLSHVKAPRQYDFRQELPRLDTGKLAKRSLRDAYWLGRGN
ncbi:acyl-CoA synthetase [Sphingopyxis sp.]|jgi:long-chain acyl-CoA synthetase|uniref:acyl-CoA synthetase n=1 Tax=Sphingopyxis sp. TaxID=1908224 RepID=UPI002DED0D2A|nr:acyl-CoA synthetase [Sphingopyxis sp.]